MTDLAEQKCVPCRGDEPKLAEAEIRALQPDLPDWQLLEVDGEKRLERSFKFKDFTEAMAFAIKIAALAEQEDHHPRLVIEWGRVTVDWWTHKVKGLHKNDFIMAARTDRLS